MLSSLLVNCFVFCFVNVTRLRCLFCVLDTAAVVRTATYEFINSIHNILISSSSFEYSLTFERKNLIVMRES